jgi:hypothetical protein
MRHPGTQGKPVACNNCEHYHITWDGHFPYGCRAHGFKSRKSPSLEVYEASGMACLLFTAKKRLVSGNDGSR